jgi:hypothetical protein
LLGPGSEIVRFVFCVISVVDIFEESVLEPKLPPLPPAPAPPPNETVYPLFKLLVIDAFVPTLLPLE